MGLADKVERRRLAPACRTDKYANFTDVEEHVWVETLAGQCIGPIMVGGVALGRCRAGEEIQLVPHGRFVAAQAATMAS